MRRGQPNAPARRCAPQPRGDPPRPASCSRSTARRPRWMTRRARRGRRRDALSALPHQGGAAHRAGRRRLPRFHRPCGARSGRRRSVTAFEGMLRLLDLDGAIPPRRDHAYRRAHLGGRRGRQGRTQRRDADRHDRAIADGSVRLDFSAADVGPLMWHHRDDALHGHRVGQRQPEIVLAGVRARQRPRLTSGAAISVRDADGGFLGRSGTAASTRRRVLGFATYGDDLDALGHTSRATGATSGSRALPSRSELRQPVLHHVADVRARRARPDAQESRPYRIDSRPTPGPRASTSTAWAPPAGGRADDQVALGQRRQHQRRRLESRLKWREGEDGETGSVPDAAPASAGVVPQGDLDR